MIDVWTSSSGKVAASTLHTLNLAKSTAWIDVTSPEQRELDAIHKQFSIPLQELRHVFDENERPRVKITNDYLLIIFGAHNTSIKDLPSTPILIFCTKKYLLTIHTQRIKGIADIDKASDLFKHIMQKGTEYLLYSLLFRIIKDYFEPLLTIEESLDAIEDDVLNRASDHSTHHISALKTTLSYLKRTLHEDSEVISFLTKTESTLKERRMFEELNIELKQLINQSDLFFERLNSALDIYYTTISSKVSEIMKTFTVLASLFIVPMFITGLYGMNVNLPLQSHPQAFWIILILIGTVIFFMMLMYKVKKWI